MAIEPPRERERLLLYLIPGLAALLVVTLVTLAFLILAKSRDASLLEAEGTTLRLAQLVEQRTAAMLQSVDGTLRSLGETWLQLPAMRDPNSAAMHTLLVQKIGRLPDVRRLFVLDARGMLVNDSDISSSASRDDSDSGYFNWHRSHPGQFHVGKPIAGRGNGQWYVVASRRLDDADGRFAGIAVAVLDQNAFRSAFSGIDTGHNGVVGLMHEDGELIASMPDAPAWLGVPTGGNLTLKDLLSNPGARTSRSVSAMDGELRIYSALRVANTPLMAQVGLSEEEALAGWREQKNVIVVILIGFTLATCVLAWLLLYELRRRVDFARSAKRSDQVLRQVLESLPVGVWVADNVGKLVLGNAAIKRIWGDFGANDAQHAANLKGRPADYRKPLAAAEWGMARAMAKREFSRNEVVNVECPDGARKTVLRSLAPLISGDGEIVGGVAVNEDVTERRALADALHESEARYRALFDHSLDAVLVMRPDGGILSANPQACQLLGYSESELCVQRWEDLTGPDDPRVAALRDEQRRKGVARGELKMRCRDGGSVPVEISSTTFRNRSGEMCATLIMRDITDRRRAEEHIEYLAYHDELTGIANRAHFQRAFEHAIATSQRQGLNSALMLVDLDRFKNINDIIGHEAGDQILKQVAARLRTCLRDGDVLARLGGDEFVILMQDASGLEAASAVANKILHATSRPLVIDEQEFLITASIGISMSPHDGTDLKTLLRNSDVAMYRAKESGKNGFQYFSPDMDAHGRERLSIESALGRALERREFILQFQPKMQVSSRNVAGMEALVRWNSPEKGLMQPSDFIAIAEETGMIVPIGDWVLTEACRQGQALRAAGHGDLRVAVNLSARQLYDEGLAMRVSEALMRTGFPAQNLELEITESMVMRDAEDAIKVLQALRDTGVRIAIDDFGTGYSSLAYLKRFPIDCVKIDRSFIRDLPEDRDDASITRSIIAMAHNMELEVVAEGVETVPQLDFLQAHGCDEIQGYLYSQPLGIAAFERFLGGHAAQSRLHRLNS